MSSQFAKTPRFNALPTSTSPASRGSHFTQKPRFGSSQANQREDVQDNGSQADEDEMLLVDDQSTVFHSVEQARPATSRNVALSETPFRSPKRRRLDEAHNVSGDTIQQQMTPARFLFQQSDHDPSRNDQASHAARPGFLKSSIPTQNSTEPLPEAFSPHKRGQRFVPGGMAAELQTWIFEAGNAASQSRRGRAYLRGEDYTMCLKAIDVTGEHPIFVQGETAEDQIPVQAILVGETDRTNLRRVKINPGDTIGIREPTWTVNVLEKQWVVGVDYRLIS